jgi:myo-inositol-1(or 4)-monophosphatase
VKAAAVELTEPELGRCAEIAAQIALDAVAELAGRRVAAGEYVTKAHPGDLVSTFDFSIEQRTRERLAAEFPGHVVVGEELGQVGEPARGSPVWYLDPIDGTTNFVHALPWSSFSLAVADDDGLAAAVIADLHRGTIFSARRGGGARRDDAPARCSSATSLAGGLVLTELAGDEPWPGLAQLLARLGGRHCAGRLMGSSALSLAQVAAGSAYGVLLPSFDPVDVAAGVLMAREAGATVLVPQAADAVLAGGGRTGTSAGAETGLAAWPGLLIAVAPGVGPELAGLVASLPG